MEVLIGLITLLFSTVIMIAIGDKFRLPWPVLLTVVIALGIFIPWMPQVEIPAELMLPIFIPPLLWALARRTSWSSIRNNWRFILLLSILLTIISAITIGFTAYLLVPSLSIAGAFIIGAAISPPDPVAVDAVAEPAGVPRRLTNALETEGLFNDAASIVVFNLALHALTMGEKITWYKALFTFFYSAVIAIMLGIAIGRISAYITNWSTNSSARNALTWIIPFTTYIAAEELHASGVIAIVIAAIEFNSRVQIEAEDRLSGAAFWEVVELLFTGVAFGLIGLTVRGAVEAVGTDLWHAVWLGAVLSLVAFLVRGLWLYVIYRQNIRRNARTGAPLRLQEVLLLTWGGMRGLVTLALVLSVPSTAGFTLYNELSVIALVVLFLTMVIPGLTLPLLTKKLNLNAGPDPFGDKARELLVKRARKAAIESMKTHSDDISEEMMSVIRERVLENSTMELEEFQELSAEERAEKIKQVGVVMNSIHLEALRAAEQELLQARRERHIDPVIVDDVLKEIDAQIIVTEKRVRA
ncbi:sodium:proton antiporter [Corynebacterium sp. sy017]|uniref:cation:proton antiporter n=1 Tax=unclassified Corynebacterium TaxID=2624378 RepID=UPI001185814B|nr:MULTISPECIES: sodium:proton antiporter [unclassified Corynebacterium]MBP3087563.1 sodium:proton antiporter [Corynebacterium sp. sy017]QDZ43530.1 sodium:proton antiporter [Corynebacterium sp. sy039]TSD92708.1 sodium:proton antiporter [Corynebacterium sp. SY003]